MADSSADASKEAKIGELPIATGDSFQQSPMQMPVSYLRYPLLDISIPSLNNAPRTTTTARQDIAPGRERAAFIVQTSQEPS